MLFICAPSYFLGPAVATALRQCTVYRPRWSVVCANYLHIVSRIATSVLLSFEMSCQLKLVFDYCLSDIVEACCGSVTVYNEYLPLRPAFASTSWVLCATRSGGIWDGIVEKQDGNIAMTLLSIFTCQDPFIPLEVAPRPPLASCLVENPISIRRQRQPMNDCTRKQAACRRFWTAENTTWLRLSRAGDVLDDRVSC